MSATGEHESSGNAVPPAASFPVTAHKPRFALFVATAAGLGYLPKAPGTWGSLAGLLLALSPWWLLNVAAALYIAAKHGDAGYGISEFAGPFGQDPFLCAQIALAILTAAIGVWSADRAAKFWQVEDPQRVVIDEVSGQHLTLLLGCGIPVWWRTVKFPWDGSPVGLISFHSVLSWKYLLLGLILFRVFDIWKPFPARRAESLPGGWGIMADDWVAAIYAAIGLWTARAAGL
jgi:phosphatidylglycerophosphatase A